MTARDSLGFQFPAKGRGLVIVAHPDDEIIWCGGLILQHPGIDWTVIALCRGSDPDRRPRFEKASRALGAKGLILDIDDSPTLKQLDIREDIVRPLTHILTEPEVNVCITHGSAGEYGHQRHIDAHNAVTMMLKEESICCDHHCFFSYQKIDNEIIVNAPDSDLYYPLNPTIFEYKRAIVRDIYGFQETSFEWHACLDVESYSSLA